MLIYDLTQLTTWRVGGRQYCSNEHDRLLRSHEVTITTNGVGYAYNTTHQISTCCCFFGHTIIFWRSSRSTYPYSLVIISLALGQPRQYQWMCFTIALSWTVTKQNKTQQIVDSVHTSWGVLYPVMMFFGKRPLLWLKFIVMTEYKIYKSVKATSMEKEHDEQH